MKLDGAFLVYGAHWSTPFAKWQGSLAGCHPLQLAAQCATEALARGQVPPGELTSLVLGTTIPSPHAFYGAPWVATLLGAPAITGPTLAQACATGAKAIASAATTLCHARDAILVACADKTSNGPHLYYPNSAGPGGKGVAEDWVWDNFNRDPVPGNAMIQTAENVAKAWGITRAEQDELTLVRYAQYADALADDAAFLRRFMPWPLQVKDAAGRKVVATVNGDEGVFASNAEGLARLRPVLAEGTVTFGTQTHPADGNAGAVVTTADRAKAWSKGGVRVALRSYAQANARKGFMAEAVVPAARLALDDAGFTAADVRIKTHNPFAVNDVLLAREFGLPFDAFNAFGSPLVYGHPQAPTGVRAILELVEELVVRGGGRGLFAGCAAGDTAAALCLEVHVA
ncbi:MAG: thiolase family protein [Deltaproteobacteria bacterium]|nr:thiolase family protein [Deltaproteobacteria bacterium]